MSTPKLKQLQVQIEELDKDFRKTLRSIEEERRKMFENIVKRFIDQA